MMETVILSKDKFADTTFLPLFDKDAVISIVSPGDTHPRPKAKLSRLNVQFHDVTEDIMDGEKLWRFMEDEHAVMIVDFAEEILPWIDRLIIHCEAGLSRSPGVGVGLSRFFNLGSTENELRDQFPHFNIAVAQKIWNECERRRLVPLALINDSGFDQRNF